MTLPRSLALLLAALVAGALGAGCGLGPGESSEGEVRLTVTRDYGADRILEASREDPRETETVLSVLDREAEIKTRYGGGFIQAIDGIEGSLAGGRTFDWFFYVNGIESEIGAADAAVAGGDMVWWDHHDWTEVMRVPAVVGSWPEPFRQASSGSERVAVRVECAGPEAPCRIAEDALADAGVSSTVVGFGDDVPGKSLRLVVGEWSAVSGDDTVGLIDRGPESSGVFARPGSNGFQLLDERGQPAGEAGGLVAATRNGEGPPTWLVTGMSPAGVTAAAELLDAETLRDRYAVATSEGIEVPLPVAGDAP